MAFDQKGKSTFCVALGVNGLWEVSEEGFEKPIATFATLDEAEEYARDLAKTKGGDSTVKLPDDRSGASRGQSSAGSRL
jgi:hypothetical protein